ncbi:hypothetical protein RchiOBHm_Chr5g0068431 [Rosa chinensis]|uniref:Uncharacterized protein n=1 Tax=Rosa chinensis TaxID=74649 RepID=A0A2P6QJP2_ROSCH|nr:hypothetical protein RchiOBHm_Chr5g0068431 [Rosa chinensis]
MLPHHIATSSFLITSTLSITRRSYGWLREGDECYCSRAIVVPSGFFNLSCLSGKVHIVSLDLSGYATFPINNLSILILYLFSLC